MATQRITIAKIAGASAQFIYDRFREWSRPIRAELAVISGMDSIPVNPAAYFSKSVQREIDEFVTALRAHSHELPVVYFSEHVDAWLIPDAYRRVFPDDVPGRSIEVWSERYGAWCYLLPDCERLCKRLQRELRRKQVQDRNPAELRWFVQSLLEGVLAWEPTVEVAAIIVVREAIGGMALDGEVEDSCNTVAEWL